MDRKLDVILLDSVDIKDMQDESAQITPVIKYMYTVQKINKSYVNDDLEKNSILFFRGQSKDVWKVDPSVFREGQLNIEHELIKEAIRRSPDELANYLTNFERLTKLQHYELATRLLDVTENPLVALYFACELEPDSDGAVYLTHTYPIYANSLEVQILAHIAHLDLRGITLRELWLSLEKGGIDLPAIEDNDDIQLLDNYINLIKRNYFVKANLDNSRIKQQSGAFLLSGCINTIIQKNKWDSVVEKKDKCLATEFTHKIIIPAEMKDVLLEELDLYNVNEATVYPELDHQMRYIKRKVKKIHIPMSTAIDDDDDEVEDSAGYTDETKLITSEELQHELWMPENLHDIISGHINDSTLGEAVYVIFMENTKVDWHVRKQLQSNISRNITRYLLQQGYANKEKCSEIAKLILADAINGASLSSEYADNTVKA